MVKRQIRSGILDQLSETATAEPPHSQPLSGRLKERWPIWALGVLVLLCALHGWRTVSGLTLPPDIDALRDIGFVQGMLDHNWFGDPSYENAARYYPPLIPALGALAARLFAIKDLPAFWVAVGPWVNLLTPVFFFLAMRGLFASGPVAATATTTFVLLNGAVVAPWLTGGYTPWVLTPLLTQAGFFAALLLIQRRLPRAGWLDAMAIGLTIGLVFLAHIIPALLLTCVLVAAAFVVHGVRGFTIVWLVVAGVFQTMLMAVYLVPILLRHPDGIINHLPGAWMAVVLEPAPKSLLYFVILNAPGALAAAVAFRLRRVAPLPPVSWAILLTWIAVCGVFLLRHEACGLLNVNASAACQFVRMPAHHFLLYLQLAWTGLIGYVAWHGAVHWASTPGRRRALFAGGLMMVAIGVALLPLRRYDRRARIDALRPGADAPMDLAAYHWILGQTPATATFLTMTPPPATAFDNPAFTVMAAGRRLVAVGPLFSNPYVSWTEHDARRLAMLAVAAGRPCSFPMDRVWAILPVGELVDPARATERFRTADNVIYEIGHCP